MTEADIAKTLLPCPFCGCQTPAFQSGISQYVNCPACYAEGPWNDDSEEEAITAWNTRVVDHPQATSPVDDRETPNMSDKLAVEVVANAIREYQAANRIWRMKDLAQAAIAAMPSLAAKDVEIARLREALTHYATDYDHETLRTIIRSAALGWSSVPDTIAQAAATALVQYFHQSATITDVVSRILDKLHRELEYPTEACALVRIAAGEYIAALPSLAAKDDEIARLREALVEIQDARTDLNDRSDYARGWNESRWNFKKIARQALGDEA